MPPPPAQHASDKRAVRTGRALRPGTTAPHARRSHADVRPFWVRVAGCHRSINQADYNLRATLGATHEFEEADQAEWADAVTHHTGIPPWLPLPAPRQGHGRTPHLPSAPGRVAGQAAEGGRPRLPGGMSPPTRRPSTDERGADKPRAASHAANRLGLHYAKGI